MIVEEVEASDEWQELVFAGVWQCHGGRGAAAVVALVGEAAGVGIVAAKFLASQELSLALGRVSVAAH